MKQPYRTPQGGCIDRNQALQFTFDGKAYSGYSGDTLASALLANGVRVVGRSFKYHRPRGVFSAGVEEPNALVQLRSGHRTEPNIRATQIELFDGLEATSQNCWPSLAFDVSAINDRLKPFLPAGFYNKTFMWPRSGWLKYEYVIRRAAGMGKAPVDPDPDDYAKRYAHCEVLIIGAGPSGLMAALAAADRGARVMLVDDNPRLGGQLRGSGVEMNDRPAMQWVTETETRLRAMTNVTLLTRATATGYYDQNLITVCERVADHLAKPMPRQPRQRLWWVRAQQVILATGAIERPLVFAGNDCPGVMLTSAARHYARDYGVRCADKAVVFTNNDSAYDSVNALLEAGGRIAAVVDSRYQGPHPHRIGELKAQGVELLTGHVVTEAYGDKGLQSVKVQGYDGGRLWGPVNNLFCDGLFVSGGWNPTVHLFSQSQGKLRYDEDLTAFVPDTSRQRERSAGASCGAWALAECLQQGLAAGRAALVEIGIEPDDSVVVPTVAKRPENPIEALWQVPVMGKKKAFVDFQNDVASSDIELAHREGYLSVEHLKRYTTLGMGTDQGRTSNVNGLAIMGILLNKSIPAVGTTTFRPPFSPLAMGAVAGGEVGSHLAPLRRTPMHDWHLSQGATMVNVGLWQRAQYYVRPGEEIWDAIYRETTHVRQKVGFVDVSTLGKIDIQGRDAAKFLEKVYVNRWRNLKIGRCRYGLILREDGFVIDDGTTTRIGEHEYYLTTTTGHAARVMTDLEFYAQTVWPQLQVHLTSVTDQWAGVALAGPHARDVLATIVDGADVSNQGLPYLGYQEVTIHGFPARLFRMTFSGEMAYEIHVPSDHGTALCEILMEAGKPWDIAPYGTEAMSILRIEKGHIVAAELDGRTVPADFGFQRMQRSDDLDDFIGKRALERPALSDASRPSLVGLVSENGRAIPRGAHITLGRVLPGQIKPHPIPTEPSSNSTLPEKLGHITSRCYSPNLQQHIALGLLRNSAEYQGKILYAVAPLDEACVPVTVTSPVFIDPEGERPRG